MPDVWVHGLAFTFPDGRASDEGFGKAFMYACRFHSVTLLQRGFVSGSILTVDPEDAQVGGIIPNV